VADRAPADAEAKQGHQVATVPEANQTVTHRKANLHVEATPAPVDGDHIAGSTDQCAAEAVDPLAIPEFLDRSKHPLPHDQPSYSWSSKPMTR